MICMEGRVTDVSPLALSFIAYLFFLIIILICRKVREKSLLSRTANICGF